MCWYRFAKTSTTALYQLQIQTTEYQLVIHSILITKIYENKKNKK